MKTGYRLFTICVLALTLLCASCTGPSEQAPDALQALAGAQMATPAALPTPPFAPTPTPEPSPALTPKSTPAPEPFFAYVNYEIDAASGNQGTLLLWIDDVLWVDIEDEEARNAYGITEDEMANDYAIYNQTEAWLPYTATEETVFFVQYDEDYDIDPREIGIVEFEQYMLTIGKDGILAEITASNQVVMKIMELYTP